MGALARETRKARILILGNPIATGASPYACRGDGDVDVYARAAWSAVVRGVHTRCRRKSSADRMMERFWEATI